MKTPPKSLRKQSGMALFLTLMLLLLLSSLMVGFILLIMSGQTVSGMNSESSRSFYAAEAGMEKLTADLGTLFDTTYAPTSAQLIAIGNAPPNIAGIQYQKFDGTSGYEMNYPLDANGNPLASVSQVMSGTFQGMTALATPYTLTITARTATGAEVKLQRTTQTVGIPMFQFGVFSDTDLSFFPGPDFSFGGRTHTNGNLFLAAGGTLTMSDRVTAVKDVIRTNLSNGFPTTTGQYNGIVNITTSPGKGRYRKLGFGEGSLTGTLGSVANPNWTNISLGATNYAGNLRGASTGPKSPLNLGIVTIGNGTTQAIDIIRRPVQNEPAPVSSGRLFAQASLKILLSDNPQDIMQLPCIDTTVQPFNLADLAQPVANWASGPALALLATLTAHNAAGLSTLPVPLAASGAVVGAAAYNPVDGYWLATPATSGIASGNPIITGFIKVEVQTLYGNPCGAWKDVTQEILGFGYAGRNLNPYGALAGAQYGASEPLLALPGVELNPAACPDVHPNAIIRLERVRDNPSNWTNGNPCGVTLVAGQVAAAPTLPADYWPNVLFDTREGTRRDVSPAGNLGGINYSKMVTLGGVMHYVEVDTNNLSRWFTGALPGNGASAFDAVTAPNDFSVYISDRRGNYVPVALPGTWPPKSPSGNETGEYGFEDFVNSASQFGCPNNAVDQGEDLDGLGAAPLFNYGQDPTHALAAANAAAPWLGGFGPFAGLNGTIPATNALTPDPKCPVAVPSAIWPGTYVINANEARENPNFFFRRAVKLVNGKLLNLGNCPGNTPCGLTIASENPVYVQGDFNANSANGGFGDPGVATSVMADAITLLSNNWNDVNSFQFPFSFGNNQRNALATWYRAAVVSGKGISFPQPAGYPTNQDFGTDGGLHNFLRYIENWGGQNLNYRGSLISVYFNRQAIGVYKCCTTVYSPPTRGYNFDVNFLTPSLLPPRTPLFRDVNTTGFTQLLLPQQ